ncbi:MAG: hypothetical protein QOH90_169 [Actinomycetota bacterium]|nr:hypothetical protein [Actinomycetota bacterium]
MAGTRPQRRFGVAVLVLLLMAVLAATLPAMADPHDRLERIQHRKERAQARRAAQAARSSSLADKIERLDARRASAERRVHHLTTKVDGLDRRIDRAQQALDEERVKLAVETEELQSILGHLETRSNLFEERARAAYMAGPTAYVDSLLSSETFSDLVQRVSYYESALDADTELITQIQILRDESEHRRSGILAKEHKITLTKQHLETDRAAVAEARERESEAVAQQRAVLADKKALLHRAERKESYYLALEDSLEQDSDEVTALIQRQEAAAAAAQVGSPSATTGISGPPGGGQLAWPAAGPVTSPFGWRTHPIFGDRRLHTGIDIGAPYGAPVWAADNGTVTFAGVMSGYGNVIVIDHGGGLSTTYNHLSAFTVGSGQSVGRGQQIGNVGCSGYCTGPHLHFEVRINGTPVDPMPYLQ